MKKIFILVVSVLLFNFFLFNSNVIKAESSIGIELN